MAEAIVHLSLLGVREDRVGLGSLLELFFSLAIPWAAIGVKLHR
jgi:hypothetical protein